MELASLLDTFRAPLVGLIASWGAPWPDAVELAQDSFSEAWIRRAGCRGDWQDPAAFGAWLRGVARNVYRNWARANRRRHLRVVTSDEAVGSAADERTPEPQSHDELRGAIDRLPRRQREVVLMHYLDETRVSDVAALLGVPPKTVEGRLYQARRSLRRLLGAAPARTEVGRMLLCL